MDCEQYGLVVYKKTSFLKDLVTYKYYFSGLKIKHSPLLQNLLRDSVGPSSKTCPWCAPH